MKRVLTIVLWGLVCLAAVRLLGEHPYWALLLAIGGGVYIGWEEANS